MVPRGVEVDWDRHRRLKTGPPARESRPAPHPEIDVVPPYGIQFHEWETVENSLAERDGLERCQLLTLSLASSLAEAALLAKELANFKLKKPASSDDIADWREAPHDDLVFAAAIVVWQAEREPLPTVVTGS